MLATKRQGTAGVRQMFDDVQQHDHIEQAKFAQDGFLGNPFDDGKTASAARRNGRVRDFNTRHLVKTPRLVQKKAVGAADLQKAAAIPKPTNELHGARKLTSQNRPAAEIVGVTVRMPAGEIVFSVIAASIKTAALGATEAAFDTS
jgi:hypothetical protein